MLLKPSRFLHPNLFTISRQAPIPKSCRQNVKKFRLLGPLDPEARGQIAPCPPLGSPVCYHIVDFEKVNKGRTYENFSQWQTEVLGHVMVVL